MAYATMMHTVTEETPTLDHSREAQAFYRKFQAATQTVELSESLLTYERNRVLVQQTPVGGLLQKYVPIPILARILYLFHYPPLSKRPRK